MAQDDTISQETQLALAEIDPMLTVVSRDVIETIITKYDPSLTLLDYTCELGSNVGDNYISIMYLATIKVAKKANPEQQSTHSIMLKTMPLNPGRQAWVNASRAFVKEAKMYGKVFPDLESFQKELGFGQDEIYKDYPLCYAAFVDGKGDYLALENLRTSGYVMADRHKGLEKNHVTQVLKSLAKFHALSYAKFHGDFHAIQAEYPELEEKMWQKGDQPLEMTKFFLISTMADNISSLRAKGFEKEASILEQPQFHVDTILQKMYEFVGKPVKYAVVGHGDVWTNNMLFKYDPADGKPSGVKFVDFQVSRPCSRTIDLLYFLMSCPQDDLINDSEEEFLRIYYDEFLEFAQKLGFLEKELTFEQLQAEYDEFRMFGVIMALLIIKIVYANSADVKDMEGIKEEMSEDNVKEFFGGMTNDVIIWKIRNIINVHVPKLKF